MKIVLAPVGTRGDVQPMLALAEALRARGHEALLCAPENFATLARERGIPFFPGSTDFERLFNTNSDFAVVRRVARDTGRLVNALMECCQGADAIVGATLQFAAPSVAEKLGLPYFFAVFCPAMIRSDAHVPVGVLRGPLPRWLTRFTWDVHVWFWNILFRRTVNFQRARLGLAPVENVHRYFMGSGYQLIAADAEAAPPPPEPRENRTVTGFWHVAEQGRLDSELEAFLNAGPPPVYVGFGSMRAGNPRRTTRIVLDALREAGVRSLVSAGWAGLGGDVPPDALPAECRLIGATPHSLLFPRLAAVVHHGGAGTFAATLRAGVPQVIVPHMADQFYWANRAGQLGVAPPSLGLTPMPWRLNRQRLAAAIRTAVSDPRMRERARSIGERLRPANGADIAAQVIEQQLLDRHSPTAEATERSNCKQ